MYPIKQSTALTVAFFAHDASGDAVTGMTDGGFTKRISKNGAAFGAMTVTITEMENGWYSFPLSTSHSDTLGILSITFTNASCKQVNLQFRVHARLPDDLAYPATSGRSLLITAAGATAIDWANVENPSSAVDLSATDIQLVDTASALTGHTPQTGDSYAEVTSGTYGLSIIEAYVDELETRLSAARAGYLDELAAANIPTDIDTLLTRLSATRAGYLDELDFDLNARLGTPSVSIAADILALNDLSAAEVNAEVDTALSDIHLDHLFATAYDATAKPGAADALLNELVEDDVGVTRYTQNALEQGPGGDATAANQTTIIGYVDDLETRLTAARAGYLDELAAANIPADIDTLVGRLTATRAGYLDELDFDLDARLGTPSASIAGDIAALNDLSAADVNAEVDTALSDIHLDHLLAVDYDPAAKPGVATALLNELIESDAGVSRFTANALEEGPGGGDATAANQTTIIGYVDELESRLTAARAGYLDELDFDLDARLGSPAGASLAADIATAQADLDTITGADGVTLATAQGLYAPSKAGDAMDLIADAVDATSLDETAIAAAVWNAVKSSYQTAGTFGRSFMPMVEAQAVTGTLSTTQMTTNLTEDTDDHYIGRTIVWLTGVLAFQATDITDYDGASKMLTYTQVTEAPSNNDYFLVI